MEHMIDAHNPRPGYRLQKMEVFNWGTFDSSDGRIHSFEPRGRTTLLVGHNGSGKSTLVDALLTLLVDSKTRNYNVAAGAKKTERTAKSYIKGAFSRTADESHVTVSRFLRPKGNHLSAISAVFKDEHLERSFTLTQVLFMKSDADDKIYGFADGEKDLKSVLSGLTHSDQVREHLQRKGYQTTRTYVEYQGWLTKRTSMRGKAIDMFNQTVHVKDIQSLNEFIRKHMLEAHDWREKVKRLLEHFDDLSRAHQELVRARKAEELLLPIERTSQKYLDLSTQVEELECQLEASSTFFAVRTIELLEPELIRQAHVMEELSQLVHRLDEELRIDRETIRQLKNEIEQSGGERLKKIPELIRLEESHLSRKQDEFHRFHERVTQSGIDEIASNDQQFAKVRERLKVVYAQAEGERRKLAKPFETLATEKAELQRKLTHERHELETVERRRTNLPSYLTAIRDQICSDLNLDENELPFAAELISVLPEDRHWESSIEMVFRSFALSLLIPTRLYPRVRSYVERNRLTNRNGDGQRLDYVCTGHHSESAGDRIHPQSVINKLRFRSNHELTPWVRHEVSKRFDFRCCDTDAEFEQVQRMAITANRHVKFNAERHQKDDRDKVSDPRYFVLGWDNTDKKHRLVKHIEKLSYDLSQVNQKLSQVDEQVKIWESKLRAAQDALKLSDFDAIDVNRHQAEIRSLENEKHDLETSNNVVVALKSRLDQIEKREWELNQKRDAAIANKGRLEREIEVVSRWLSNARSEFATAQAAGIVDDQQRLFAAIQESLGSAELNIENLHLTRDQWRRTTDKKLSEARKPLEELSGKLVARMSAYLSEFKESANDLDADVRSIPSFIAILNQLRTEGLPTFEKKFKDRLDDQVSQEIGLFNNELRQECKRIEDKIEQLNHALSAVAYNRGTRMRLQPRRVKDVDVENFRHALNRCLDDSLTPSDDTNEARFLRIRTLVQWLADKERTAWRSKVIDVRNWFDFAAQEIDSQTGVIKSSYDGSSGQSGGEKAKLAFTILVAALAYQYDVDPNGGTAGRFQFVVVDEMFSKVDDHNATFALQLFKQFGLQLLIVAPLDAKARITEPFVDRYLHAVKDAESSKSMLYCMTAQEYEEVAKAFTGT
jgi:uncharacterized protein YPO0396